MLLTVLSSNVFAAEIEGNTSGSFINPAGPIGMITTGAGTNNFTWGTPFGSNNKSSSLTFTGTSIGTSFNIPFTFGVLNYFNGTIISGTGAQQVDLALNLTLTAPTGLSNNFSYTLKLINILDTGTPEENADYVIFPTNFPTANFSLEGLDYTLAFSGFGSITGGGFSQLNEFHVLEGYGANADLIGQITQVSPAVPEPSSLTLLASVVLGIIGVRRRKISSLK